jgi:mannosyltransferase
MTVLRAWRAGFSMLVLVWLAFALRACGLEFQSLWRDEADALRFATRALPELLATFRQPGENGPLYFASLRPWLAVSGRSEFALRFPSVWAGTLAIPMIYVLMRRLTGSRPAFISALLAATAPYLIWYAQEGKMYAALTLLVPLSLWLTVRALQRGGWWRWLLLYLVTSACFYTHLLAVLIVPVQVLWMLVLPSGRQPSRRWVNAAIYAAALCLPYLPLLRWQAGMLRSTLQTGHPFVPLGDILAVLAVTYSRGVLPVKMPVTLLPAILALVAGLGYWAIQATNAQESAGPGIDGPPSREDRWRVVAALAVWLLLPPLGVYFVSLRVPVFADRYLIWCMPAFLALAALGVVAMARLWRPFGAMVLAAMLVASLAGVWAQGSRPIKSDFRSAARFVLAHRQPGDLLLFQIPYSRYLFGYYADGGASNSPAVSGQLPWADGPYTNNGASEAAVAEQMARETAGSPAVWLVASEVPMWDQRDLAQRWLSENGRVTDQGDFTLVSVIRYQLDE